MRRPRDGPHPTRLPEYWAREPDTARHNRASRFGGRPADAGRRRDYLFPPFAPSAGAIFVAFSTWVLPRSGQSFSTSEPVTVTRLPSKALAWASTADTSTSMPPV